MIELTYYQFGYKYTETLTIEQARQELIDYGWPDVDKLTDLQVCETAREIYQ
jgi:hypothetical protein